MFKEFRIGDLFKVDDTWIYGKNKQYDSRLDNPTSSSVAVISGITVNNGINYYTDDILDESEIYSDCLTISTRGEYSGTVFYHDYPFVLANNILVMPMPNLSKEAKLYIAALLNRLPYGGYNHYPKKDTLKEDYIELPVIENPNPDHEYTVDDIDWQYMRDRITELERDRITALDAYLQATGLNDYELTEEDEKVLSGSKDISKLGKFKATSLFDIKKGKRLTKADMIEGDINFVGSSASNNGITARIGNTEYLHPAHTFTVSYNGSVGEVFLQDEPFWASDDVNVWYPKFPYNQRVIEYIMSVVRQLKAKYSYTAKWTLDKMQAEVLELPIKSDGTPDFDYMERYIRAMEKIVIADVVKYKDKVVNATKSLINK